MIGLYIELATVAAGFIATCVLFAWSLCWTAASFDREYNRGRAADTADPTATRGKPRDNNRF